MPPDEDNVIDVKKVGYLQYVDVPTKKDFDSYVEGYEKTHGKAKTHILDLYDIDKVKFGTIKVDEDSIIPIIFQALLNSEYLPLIEANGKECKEGTYVRAQDILYEINLAQRNTKGYALVPGTKVDESPDNEIKRKAFLGFEKDLGDFLYKSPEVITLSEHVKEKCVQIIKELNTKDKKFNRFANHEDLDKTFTSKKGNPTIAGDTQFDVGVASNVIKNIGNIRETMTVFMNFARAKDFLVNQKNYADTDLNIVVKDNIAATGTGRLIPDSGIKSEDVQNQKVNRGKAEENAFLQEKSDQKIDSPNLKLTLEEKKLQESGGKGDGLLKWSQGQDVWRLNEDADFVKMARDLSLPLKAGPSGTTDRLFQLNKTFNMNIAPKDFIALVIAYILPINAHSLVEVITAARPYIGIGGNDMREFYRDLLFHSPIVGQAMFLVLKSGKYPDVADALGIV